MDLTDNVIKEVQQKDGLIASFLIPFRRKH